MTLSKRERAFLSALTDGPKQVTMWGGRVLSKFPGWREETSWKLRNRGFIMITASDNAFVYRITPDGRAALEEGNEQGNQAAQASAGKIAAH